MLDEMLEFLVRPLRSALGVAEHEAVTPFETTEREIADAADAVRRASDSIEHHIEVVEGLATAVGPLTDSVNRLTATMSDLVVLLAPMAKAEHEAAAVDREIRAVKGVLGLRHHDKGAEPSPERSDS
jgi:phage-related minor tail protein